MLRTLEDLHDYSIGAIDGDIGHVKDLYLDDQAWVVRYLVVDTGGWLPAKKVLISPMSISHPDWAKRRLAVSITKEQVKNSPDFDSEKPVTRQHKIDYSIYYGYPYYWGSTGIWGEGVYPSMMLPNSGRGGVAPAMGKDVLDAEASRAAQTDPHLRSCQAITGYHIHASDGDIGHVQGMLIDDEAWAVRYLVVDTSNWWGGHRMLVAPQWIEGVSWADRTVSVKLTRQAVKDAPAFERGGTLTRDDEARLHAHYGRSGYWATGEKPGSEESNA